MRVVTIAARALAAHRAPRKAQVPDRNRFAVFVQAIADALDAPERPVLAEALTIAQHRILDARLSSVSSESPLPPTATDA